MTAAAFAIRIDFYSTTANKRFIFIKLFIDLNFYHQNI